MAARERILLSSMMASGHNSASAHCCLARLRAGKASVPQLVKIATDSRTGFHTSLKVMASPCQIRSATGCLQPQVRSATSAHQSEAVLDEQSPLEPETISFRERLHRAWSVLLGTSTQAQATKRRFTKLLINDRGFSSTNLTRLYNVAEGAIKEHVELQHDNYTLAVAVAEQLGELRFDFRVRRVKLLNEPDCTSLPEMKPIKSVVGDQSSHESWTTGSSEDRAGRSIAANSLLDAQPVDRS